MPADNFCTGVILQAWRCLIDKISEIPSIPEGIRFDGEGLLAVLAGSRFCFHGICIL